MTVRARKADVTRELVLMQHFQVGIRSFRPLSVASRLLIYFNHASSDVPPPSPVFPSHVTGPYRNGQQNLPHLYVSSYTTALTALIRARRRDTSNSESAQNHFIAIGQAKAAGENKFLSVGAELINIRQRVDGLVTYS
jgi:hypothetical protein